MQDLPENGTVAHANGRSVSDPKPHAEDPLETVVKSILKAKKSARLEMEDGGKVSPSRWSIRNISHQLHEKLCGGGNCCPCCPLERKTKTMVVATVVICLSMGSYFLATSLQNVTISDSSDLVRVYHFHCVLFHQVKPSLQCVQVGLTANYILCNCI